MALGLVLLYLAAHLAQKWIKNEGASCLGLIVQGASCLTFSEECIPKHRKHNNSCCDDGK